MTDNVHSLKIKASHCSSAARFVGISSIPIASIRHLSAIFGLRTKLINYFEMIIRFVRIIFEKKIHR